MTLDTTDDLLWQQLKTLPAFRALLRAVEARFYAYVELPEPLLDIGCGDGNFAQLALPGRRITAGIDPWWRPLNKAVKAGNYELPLQALGDNLPFADNYFASAFSNSVLEHIPDIQPVLNEISRVLRPGARFLITTPSHYFTEFLGGAAFLSTSAWLGWPNGIDAGSISYHVTRIPTHLKPGPTGWQRPASPSSIGNITSLARPYTPWR